MDSLGHQIIADFKLCSADVLKDVRSIRDIMLRAALESHCTIVSDTFHHFSPYGVSGAVIIAESHIAIHTWPEYGFAAVDVFTCGDTIDPNIALHVIKSGLGSLEMHAVFLQRGQTQFLGVDRCVNKAFSAEEYISR